MGESIQHFIESADELVLYCHNSRCNHRHRIDMIKLRDWLGPDHGVLHDDIIPKLWCPKCKGKALGLIRHNAETLGRYPKPGSVHNMHYPKRS